MRIRLEIIWMLKIGISNRERTMEFITCRANECLCGLAWASEKNVCANCKSTEETECMWFSPRSACANVLARSIQNIHGFKEPKERCKIILSTQTNCYSSMM